jgi:DNA-binding transcriptional MerR regulator
MLTLFGEELIPEQIQGAPKLPVKKAEAAGTESGVPAKPPVDAGDIADTIILAGWTPDKQYYTIGEVAALFNVRTSHIRYWTTEFGLKVRTTRKGDRLYTPAKIEELRSIYHLLKERGFTIPGAKARLKGGGPQSSVEALDLKQALLQLRNQLLTIRNELL